MAELMNHVKTVNSSVRTLLLVGVCGAVGYGGYVGYENYVKPSQEAKQAMQDLEVLKEDFAKQAEQLKQNQLQLEQTAEELKISEELNERLETSMKLLKVDRRIANITVLEKGTDDEGEPFMEVSFTEVDEHGEQVGYTKNYVIKGEKVYIDGWVASFDDKYVEQADELRSASIFAFKSIYGDAEMPKNAQRLDAESQSDAPGIYKDSKQRDFEQKIWSDFWAVCNDNSLQEELGIRTVQGQTSYLKPELGRTYQVKIRASGGMELDPVDEP